MSTQESFSDHGKQIKIDAAIERLIACYDIGGKLMVCGNGGSAADCEHIVGELMKGFHSKRPLSTDDIRPFVDALPNDGVTIAGRLQKGISAISLVSHSALYSAIVNDMGQGYEFAQQIYSLGRPRDVLLGISTSGKPNSKLLFVTI